jgi:hypothetical protein
VPGDEVHDDADGTVDAVPDVRRARTGPRHAAPRKPLLTRLHVPTGKAIAIAAMPSAVLMGMGLTPQLANAKGLPKSPFRDGPCVSAPDKAPEDQDAAEAKKKEEQEKAAREKAAQEEAEKKAEQQDSPAKDDSAEPKPGPSDSGSSDSGDDSPTPAPSESQKDGGGLLGGLGDALGGLLGGGGSKDESSGQPTRAEPAEPSSSESGSKDPAGAVDDVLDGVKDGVKDATDGVKDTVDEATQDAKDAADEAAGDKSAAEGEQAKDDSGKPAFPCVEEKKVDGTDEQTPVMLPNRPWHLESSLLSLHGLDYKGVVNVRTPDGGTKQVLKFTASGIDIGDLHQIVDGPGGAKYHVAAAAGSTSTVRQGTVTMYTEELKGNLFGLIPITFDPEHPPPLNVSEAFFTNAKVTQAGQFGGTLTVPGLHQYITGD